MLEQMLADRRIENNECNIKNAKTELKSAIGIHSGIQIWDWNQMLRLHNNLHLKWHTRSNMCVQRRNGQQTWILTWLCPKFYKLKGGDFRVKISPQSFIQLFELQRSYTL